MSFFFGFWRNIIFSENMVFSGRKLNHDRPLRMPIPWGIAPPSNNFWLIAEIQETGELVQCAYNLDSRYYTPVFDENGIFTGYGWADQRILSWLTIGSYWNPDPPYLWLYYHYDASRNFFYRATVPEGITIKLYFGCDFIAVSGLGERIYGVGMDNNGIVWDSWDDYFTSINGAVMGVWASSDTFTVEDPNPPDIPGQPPPSELKFVEYLMIEGEDTVDGEDWLPEPGSKIGLKFTATDANGIDENRIVYEIFDITTWQGETMNTPVGAPFPRATGTGTHFDFSVDNPILEQGPKYTITVHDFDLYMDDLGGGWGPDRPQAGTPVSIRRYTVERNELVKEDIPWLTAKDYAAHAVVMPRCNCPERLRLKYETSKYYDGAPLWAVTVPRDYDGYQLTGVNRGDYMADAWEEDMLGVALYDQKIMEFNPFYDIHTDSLGERTFVFADSDTLPIGRNIKGDRLSNWEEYRGFELTGDPDSAYYAQPKHIRLDPNRKNVMVSWRENELQPEVAANIPAWLELLSNRNNDSLNLEIYFIKTYIDEDMRFNKLRCINMHQFGASFPYYGVERVTIRPSNFLQNAVTWWEVNNAERDWLLNSKGIVLPGSDITGISWTVGNRYGFQTPEYHSRIYIVYSEISKWKTEPYYTANDSLWEADRDSLLKNEMSHEFGHSIGMNDVWENFIMNHEPPIDYNSGQFFPNANYVPDYSTVDQQMISVRPK
ncbi:MAG: hypothetical protein P9X24_18240 [Candidatus Hatepunaea meridiana]|nr:hypothetical protein [Candidatus Hatepunaea meridiana]